MIRNKAPLTKSVYIPCIISQIGVKGWSKRLGRLRGPFLINIKKIEVSLDPLSGYMVKGYCESQDQIKMGII